MVALLVLAEGQSYLQGIAIGEQALAPGVGRGPVRLASLVSDALPLLAGTWTRKRWRLPSEAERFHQKYCEWLKNAKNKPCPPLRRFRPSRAAAQPPERGRGWGSRTGPAVRTMARKFWTGRVRESESSATAR